MYQLTHYEMIVLMSLNCSDAEWDHSLKGSGMRLFPRPSINICPHSHSQPAATVRRLCAWYVLCSSGMKGSQCHHNNRKCGELLGGERDSGQVKRRCVFTIVSYINFSAMLS